MLRQILRLTVHITLAIFITTTLVAAEPMERTNTTALWFENWQGLSNATLKVSTPDGALIDIFAPTGTPRFQLRAVNPVVDGVYNYELSAATDEMVPVQNQLDNGRGKAAKKETAQSFQMGGFFIVNRGVITKRENLVEE